MADFLQGFNMNTERAIELNKVLDDVKNGLKEKIGSLEGIGGEEAWEEHPEKMNEIIELLEDAIKKIESLGSLAIEI